MDYKNYSKCFQKLQAAKETVYIFSYIFVGKGALFKIEDISQKVMIYISKPSGQIKNLFSFFLQYTIENKNKRNYKEKAKVDK